MLYKNKYGQVMDEEELNGKGPLLIEEEGIHAVDDWSAWDDNN